MPTNEHAKIGWKNYRIDVVESEPKMTKIPLGLHHELMLLILDDSKGHFTGMMIQYGVAGAVLSDLLLQGLLSVSKEEPRLVSTLVEQEIHDPIVADVVKMVSDSKKPMNLQHWVNAVAHMPGLCERIAKQLCELGILSYEESKVLWVFTKIRFPEVDDSYELAIRKRMADVMFHPGVKPDERTAVLIALAKSTHVLPANFASVELTQHAERINEICEGKSLASGATVETIAAVQASLLAIQVATTAATTAVIAATIN